MAVEDYIYFNTTDAIRKPADFSPQREDVYAGEYTTCTGAIKADRIGWKYSDMTLHWDALSEDDVAILVALGAGDTLDFDDLDGTTASENIIRTSIVGLRHRYTINSKVWWKDVSVDVRFIDVH